jgi:hypothetical protein
VIKRLFDVGLGARRQLCSTKQLKKPAVSSTICCKRITQDKADDVASGKALRDTVGLADTSLNVMLRLQFNRDNRRLQLADAVIDGIKIVDQRVQELRLRSHSHRYIL